MPLPYRKLIEDKARAVRLLAHNGILQDLRRELTQRIRVADCALLAVFFCEYARDQTRRIPGWFVESDRGIRAAWGLSDQLMADLGAALRNPDGTLWGELFFPMLIPDGRYIGRPVLVLQGSVGFTSDIPEGELESTRDLHEAARRYFGFDDGRARVLANILRQFSFEFSITGHGINGRLAALVGRETPRCQIFTFSGIDLMNEFQLPEEQIRKYVFKFDFSSVLVKEIAALNAEQTARSIGAICANVRALSDERLQRWRAIESTAAYRILLFLIAKFDQQGGLECQRFAGCILRSVAVDEEEHGKLIRVPPPPAVPPNSLSSLVNAIKDFSTDIRRLAEGRPELDASVRNLLPASLIENCFSPLFDRSSIAAILPAVGHRVSTKTDEIAEKLPPSRGALPLDTPSVLVIGGHGVGKSSIARAFGVLPSLSSTATQAAFAQLDWPIFGDIGEIVHFYDTPAVPSAKDKGGEMGPLEIIRGQFRTAALVIFVVAQNDKESLDFCRSLSPMVVREVGRTARFLLVVNKCDLNPHPEFTPATVERLAEVLQCQERVFRTSVPDGIPGHEYVEAFEKFKTACYRTLAARVAH
jgi:GTPase SAR1 family protein